MCNSTIARLLLGVLLLARVGFSGAGELVTYYHNDVAGSPVAATDQRGYVMWRAAYEPYGERLQGSTDYAASLDNDRWFTSHVEDVETNTIYMQARHYDPVIGRFMSVDPVRFTPEEPHTFTRYAYAANNPYRYNDPDGEFINFLVGGVKAAVENAIIQRVEMSLGMRDSFSWGELAIDTAIGTATSGLSTIKSGAKLVRLADRVADAGGLGKVAKVADDVASSAGGAKGVEPLVRGGASLDNITAQQALRIQNAANRIGKDISLVGSRARGTSKSESDWDYVINANARVRNSVSSSLPGSGNPSEGVRKSIDVFREPLDEALPSITFSPVK